PYFERYVALRPDNLDLLIPVGMAGAGGADGDIISLYRRLLAVTPDDLELLDALTDDLLRVGNAEAALFMWEHVARLLPDRLEVYREIVDLLERLGRDERLAEILEIIHRLAPAEVKVVSKLARLKVARGELLSGLDYYNKLETAGYGGGDLFEGRGRVYEELGRLAPALADYRRLLALQPGRLDIRRRSITLAGKLGENRFLREQVARLEEVADPGDHDGDLLLTARALAEAHDFDEALTRYRLLISRRAYPDPIRREGDDPDPLTREAKLGLADLYLKQGLEFEAEQLLREEFLSGAGQGEVLARLFDIALAHENPRISEAKVWLDRYASLAPDSGSARLMKARFYVATQAYGSAGDLLERLLDDGATGNNHSSSAVENDREINRRAGLLLSEVLFKAGELAKAARQGRAMLEAARDREALVIMQKIYQALGKTKDAAVIRNQLFDEARDSHELLIIAELYGEHGLQSDRVAAAEKAFKLAPDSLAAVSILAGGWAAEGRFSQAIKLLEDMTGIHPGNHWIILELARYYYLNGQYASALYHCDRFLAINPDRLDAHFLRMQCMTALADDRYAVEAVNRLFPVKTEELLKNQDAATGIEPRRPPGKGTILQWLTFSGPKRLSIADQVMSARHLVDNASREKRTLNYIAARLYARYRWEQRFSREAVGE
ncbi:MAG: hypothetical protein RQ753_05720, partial [Desulfurivibrionaceae bacterium]|nr:hypothetical protein [Desulfurivibrionaceae bacterium]